MHAQGSCEVGSIQIFSNILGGYWKVEMIDGRGKILYSAWAMNSVFEGSFQILNLCKSSTTET